MSKPNDTRKSWTELKVFHKGLILVLSPLLIEIILILCLAYMLQQSDIESARETRYRRCAAIGAKLLSLANDSLVAAFISYQGDPKVFLPLFDASRKKMEERQQRLAEIASFDKQAQKAARQLTESLADLTPLLDEIAGPARQRKRIFELSTEFNHLINNFIAKHQLVMERMASVCKLQEEIAEASTRRRAQLQALQFQILAAGIAANLAAGIILLALYRAGISQRLKVVMQNTMKLAQEKALAQRLSGRDEIAQLDAAFHDMADSLKLAAQREKALFENAGDVICVLDYNLRFVKVNQACAALWGYEPAQLLQKSVLDIIIPSEKETASRLFARAFEAGELADLELSVEKADGGASESLWSSYYSRQEQNLYCVVHDITERKEVERLKQAFLTMMTSDLREPLGKISDDIRRLLGPLRQELTGKAISYLDTANKNIGRLLLLVSDLLKMTELQVGTLAASRCRCKVAEVLQAAVTELAGLSRKSEIKFVVECSASEWWVDQNRVMQVLVNLGSNAIKFSPAGSTVVVRAASSNQFVEVEIIDQGRGVPASHRTSIFEKFTQVEAADGKRKAGTGLGLPICKEIVEDGGGEIGVKSAPGEGSIFWFRLPQDEVSFEEEMKRRADSRIPGTAPSETQGSSGTAPARTHEAPSGAPGLPVLTSGRSLSEKHPADPTALGTNLSLMQKGAVLILIPLIFEIFFVFSIYDVLLQTQKSQLEEQHARQIASTAYKMEEAFIAASNLVVRHRSPENWVLYDNKCSQILATGAELSRLVQQDPVDRAQFVPIARILSRVEPLVKRGRSIMSGEFTVDNAENAAIDRCQMWAFAIGSSKRLSRLIDEAETKEFTSPDKQIELRKQQGLLLLLGLAGSALLSIALARFFSSDITSRLAAQADNTGRFARDLPLNPPFPGADEIARLDRSFHQAAEALAEARRKERAVIDNSKDLICILDKDAAFVVTNPAARRLLGCDREELASRSLVSFLSEPEKESFQRIWREGLNSRKRHELRLVRSDGKNVYLMLSLARPQEQDNIYCVGHDISHRKELEQIKQEFLAVVSHDLRSPLSALTVTAELIEEGASGKIGSDATPVVHDIIVQCGQLIELIGDLLDFEKLQASKMQLLKKTVAPGKILEKVIANLKSRYEQLEFIVSGGPPTAELNVDSDRLVQAFSNILDHISQTESRSSTENPARTGVPWTIEIRQSADKSTYRLEFFDNGPRLSEEESLSLFAPMSSSSLTPLTRHGKSILALPLAASIIKAHEGSIKVIPQHTGRNIYLIELPYRIDSRNTHESADTNAGSEEARQR